MYRTKPLYSPNPDNYSEGPSAKPGQSYLFGEPLTRGNKELFGQEISQSDSPSNLETKADDSLPLFSNRGQNDLFE